MPVRFRRITAELAHRVAIALDAGEPVEAVAQRHRITPYVAETIAQFYPRDRPAPPQVHTRYRAGGSRAIDPADLPRVERLLKAGLTLREMAELTGIGQKLLLPIAVHVLFDAGRRAPTVARRLGISIPAARRIRARGLYFGPREALRAGEQYVTSPTKCPTCLMPLRIVPCRACRVREAAGNVAETNGATRLPASNPPERRIV